MALCRGRTQSEIASNSPLTVAVIAQDPNVRLVTKPSASVNQSGAKPRWRQCRFQLLLGLAAVVSSPSAQASTFAQEVKPFLTKHCLPCHNATVRTAEISLDTFEPDDPLRNRQDTWQAVLRELRAGRMPPRVALSPRLSNCGQ